MWTQMAIAAVIIYVSCNGASFKIKRPDLGSLSISDQWAEAVLSRFSDPWLREADQSRWQEFAHVAQSDVFGIMLVSTMI